MDFTFKAARCIICEKANFRKLGIRGTREFQGADPEFEPHVVVDVVKCANCGFVFTDPKVEGLDKLESDHYNNIEKYQAAEIDDVSAMFAKRANILKKFKSEGTLLDVGAGKGEFLNEALRKNYKVVGVEPSSEFCKHIAQNEQIEIHCGYLGDVEALKDKKFDVITMFHVLEHVHHPKDLVNILSSNLKDDGILFVEVPNVDSLFISLINLYYKIKGLGWSGNLSPFHPPFHQYGYNANSLKYLFESNGFKTLTIKTLSGRDRGFTYKEGQNKLLVFFRNLVMNLVDLMGNRELIYIVLQKNNK